jgi:regulator of RNase E activity RraA
VFARSTVSSTARGRIVEHAWNVSVVIGRVNVEPGDLVIADSSGVVFIPKEREEEVVAKAEEIAAKEVAMGKAVRSGKPVSQVMGGDYEKMLVSGD